jgi:hypothetical protein
VALLQGAVNVKSVITLHVSNQTTHPHYWQLILFAWDPGGYLPEITNVMLEFEASYRSTQGMYYCGASAWSTHCNFIVNVGIPFQFPLYVVKSCGKQRKLNGGNVNVVSGVGTLFQNGVGEPVASTVTYMDQMVLHVAVHWPAAYLELRPYLMAGVSSIINHNSTRTSHQRRHVWEQSWMW